jgi:Flp pilus assembly protein TadG
MRFFSPKGFLADRRGNVAMMYALVLPVLIFGAGFAIDYTHAMQVQTDLDAAADAAVLAALTPQMMQQSDATAQTAAQNMFNAEASVIPSLIVGKTNVTVTITNPGNSALNRTVVVTYTAANSNIFSGILGYSALQVAGTSTANSSLAPNVDFYLLLDNSPSMALPATTTGVSLLQSLTTQQESGGCAFACHEVSTGGDTAGNPYWNPSNTSQNCTGAQSGSTNVGCIQMDNYQVAKSNGLTLRIDELNTGVTTLMSTASSTTGSSPQSPPPAYRFAANSIDATYQTGFTSLMSLTSNYVNNNACTPGNSGAIPGTIANDALYCTGGTGTNDQETNLDGVMTSVNTLMPLPGLGTNTAGDTPQEVLFIVTDGVADEQNTSCTGTTSGSGRCYEPINTTLCTAIKARGIRIAVLYTTYLAVTNDSWYNSYVEPINVNPVSNSQIRDNLEACASTSLYAEAGVGDDLGTALTNLFNTVTNTAHLTN